MNGLLEQYKKNPKFLKMIIKMTNVAEIINDIMKEMEEKYPAPENTEYDFSLKTKTLRIIKKK
ncbi:MAG: hypothetical protein WC346_13225 [Methanogenium sp.]|jgi:hypothetical protein